MACVGKPSISECRDTRAWCLRVVPGQVVMSWLLELTWVATRIAFCDVLLAVASVGGWPCSYSTATCDDFYQLSMGII